MNWPEPLGLRFSLEELALIAVARKELDEKSFNLLHAITHQPINWKQLLDVAEWHKLQGFLYKHLSRPEFADHAPKEAMQLLEVRYKRNVARHMFFEQELSKIMGTLGEGGIETILMKGAALVPEIYGGDAGLRPMVDVDLIVRNDLAANAEKLLRGIGFRPSVDEEEQARMRLVDRQLAAMGRPGSPVIVEIHTHLVPTDSPIRFEMKKIWAHSKPSETGGVEHYRLDPTALLAAQSINFMKDRRFYSYSALGQLCDVAEVVRAYADEINWDAFARDGELSELQGVVYGSLYLAHELLNATVPGEAMSRITPEQFNTRMAATLVRDRVLGMDWLAKDLDSANGWSKVWKLPLSMSRRVFLSRSQLEYRAHPGEKVTSLDLLARNTERLGTAFKFALRSAVHPRRLYEDLSVDSWLKSLAKPEQN